MYWTYLEAILRKFYESSAKEHHPQPYTAQNEVGKMYWGSGGSYVGTNMRREFVEKIVHISCGEDLMDENLPSVLEVSEGVTD